MSLSFRRKTPSSRSSLESTHENTSYQTYIDRYSVSDSLKECESEKLKQKQTARELIELIPLLENLKIELDAIKNEAEKQFISQFQCSSVDDMQKKLQKKFSDLRHASEHFINEKEYDDFRNCYHTIPEAILKIEKALSDILHMLPEKQALEDSQKQIQKRRHALQPKNETSSTSPWLSEKLAQFAADQFKAESGFGLCLPSKEHELITLLKMNADPAAKEKQVESYLGDHLNQTSRLRNILFTLKLAAHDKQDAHWLAEKDGVTKIVTTFNTKSNASLFSRDPESTRQVVKFLESDSNTLKDKQIVIDYYLRRDKNTRLSKILQEERKKQPQTEQKRNSQPT